MRAGGTGQDGHIALIQSDIWIGFPRAERVLDRLQSLIDAPQQTRMPGLLVHGASGIGKTMIARNLSRRYAPEYDPAAGITHTPLLLLQAPPAPDERGSICISSRRSARRQRRWASAHRALPPSKSE